jgi:hypothetical protein
VAPGGARAAAAAELHPGAAQERADRDLQTGRPNADSAADSRTRVKRAFPQREQSARLRSGAARVRSRRLAGCPSRTRIFGGTSPQGILDGALISPPDTFAFRARTSGTVCLNVSFCTARSTSLNRSPFSWRRKAPTVPHLQRKVRSPSGPLCPWGQERDRFAPRGAGGS